MADFPARFVFGTLMLMTGGLFSLFGAFEVNRSFQCEMTPQVMTCEELNAHGPGDNDYVTLTNYAVLPGRVSTYNQQGALLDMYAPLAPRPADGEPRVKDVRIIAHCESVNGVSQEFLLAQGQVSGVVGTKGGCGAQSRENLRIKNPGLDPDSCWLFHVGKAPKPREQALGMWIGSVLLFGVGAWVIASAPTIKLTQTAGQVGVAHLLNWFSQRFLQQRRPAIVAAGLAMLAVGGILARGLFSRDLSDGTLLGSILPLDFGMALTVIGIAPFLRGQRGPEASPSEGEEEELEKNPDPNASHFGLLPQGLAASFPRSDDVKTEASYSSSIPGSPHNSRF